MSRDDADFRRIIEAAGGKVYEECARERDAAISDLLGLVEEALNCIGASNGEVVFQPNDYAPGLYAQCTKITEKYTLSHQPNCAHDNL